MTTRNAPVGFDADFVGLRRFARHRRRAGLTLVDVLVLGFIIVATLWLLLGPMTHVRDRGHNRVRCGNNLSQIGRALMLYAIENKGLFPRTRYNPDKERGRNNFLE